METRHAHTKWEDCLTDLIANTLHSTLRGGGMKHVRGNFEDLYEYDESEQPQVRITNKKVIITFL